MGLTSPFDKNRGMTVMEGIWWTSKEGGGFWNDVVIGKIPSDKISLSLRLLTDMYGYCPSVRSASKTRGQTRFKPG